MATMRGAWLVCCQALLLSCAGCGPKGCSFKGAPVMMRPPASPVASPAPVEPASNTAAAHATVEPSPVPPGSPGDLPSNLPAATVESTEFPATVAPANNDLLHEKFTDVAGSIRWNRDGVKSSEGPPSTRTIYFFNGPPEGGPLVMRVVEDNASLGPDEQPGVLALSWPEIPPKLPYSGVTFLGGRASEDRLTLPPLQRVKAAADLGQFRLTFRHKAVNESRTEPISLAIGCRLEPMLGDSYAKRIDLGNFTATGEWGSFEMSLDKGTNAEAFLAAIASENPTSFKIVWAQGGPIDNYRAGDTLLIDDIVITGAKAE